MKQQWDKLWGGLEQMNADLQQFLEEIKLSPAAQKAVKPVIKSWGKLKGDAQDFDKFVTPIEPLEVGIPWETEKFAEMWKFYKEFLLEQHCIAMKSRAEHMALKYLAEIADSNEEKAIRILEFSMYLRSKSFIIPPSKKEENNKLVKEVEDGTFG